MTDEDIRLLGQPVKITIPANYSYTAHTKGLPVLKGGETYDGFILSYGNAWYERQSNTFLDINNRLYDLRNWCVSLVRDLAGDNITVVQQEITYENIRKMILLLYQKIDELEDRINRRDD